MATTPPTDLLHRSLLINMALVPLYTHVFMTLPIYTEQADSMFDEILSFLWKRHSDGNEVQKRILVSKKRISASYEMGGLQIPHPQQTIEGMQINIIQKIYRKKANKEQDTNVGLLLDHLLEYIQRPNLKMHVNKMGPLAWEKTGERMQDSNKIIAQAFQSVAKFQRIQEREPDTWAYAAIYGHSMSNNSLPFTRTELMELMREKVTTISHLFQITERGHVLPEFNDILELKFEDNPFLYFKLKNLYNNIVKGKFRINIQSWCDDTALKETMKSYVNMSRIYKKLNRKKLDNEIKMPPAYATRIRDGVQTVYKTSFREAYGHVRNQNLPSKTKENSFQVLNRTLWTNNKGFKSGVLDSDKCSYCDKVETMEHLLCECDNYSYLQWVDLSKYLTKLARSLDQSLCDINVGFQAIIFNQEIEAVTRHVKSTSIRKLIQMLIHEIRRDIYYRKVNHTTVIRGEVHSTRRRAHLMAVFKKVGSFLEYQNHPKWTLAIEANNKLLEYVSEDID